MSAALKEALAAREAASEALAQVLRRDYPIGADIAWSWQWKGDHHIGTVVMHCHGDRIKVRNKLTGRERFIHAYNIV